MQYKIVYPHTIVFIIFIFAGCNGYDSNGGIINPPGGSTGGTVQTPVTLATTTDGAQAMSLILQSKEALRSSVDIFTSLGFMAQSQMVSAASGTGTVSCADYGTYAFNRTYSNNTYNLTLTFALCRDKGFQYDGGFTAYGTPNNLRGNLGGLKILNFKNNYSTLIGSINAVTANYTMAGTGDASNGDYLITANGTLAAFDYYSLGQHTVTFTSLATNATFTTSGSTKTRTITANGKYSARRQTTTTAVTYTNFSIVESTDTALSRTDEQLSGRISIDRTPNSGLEGVLDATTPTAIRTDFSSYPPITTQGIIVTNTTASATYGASDTIDVSVAGDTTATYAKEFILMKTGDFYGMEQQLPIVSGTTGTATGTVMSISALSTAPSSTDLNCYTDVHVSYFVSTAPTSTVPDWYVHWASNLDTCVPQTGIPYQEATSSTGNPSDPCDVGLDINGSAQDISSGGVEHFLAASLPVGYYILSINNYSCSTLVTNTATVLIGDYLFGPYTCTYTAADGDGSTPGAWCRLADIRVNASGVIDVLTPDPLLPPWHP